MKSIILNEIYIKKTREKNNFVFKQNSCDNDYLKPPSFAVGVCFATNSFPKIEHCTVLKIAFYRYIQKGQVCYY